MHFQELQISFNKPKSENLSPDKVSSIFTVRPLLHQFLDSYGDLPVTKYLQNVLLHHLPFPSAERQEQFIHSITKLIQVRMGDKVSNEVATQLKHYFFVSTADHHTALASSLAVNSNLMMASAYKYINDSVLKYVIVLSCAGISLSNDDFPRGLLFHTYSSDHFETQRLAFLPSNSHSSVVYGFRSYSEAEVLKVQKLLEEKTRERLITDQQKEIFTEFINNTYLRSEILNSKGYCEQITQVNYSLWESCSGVKTSHFYPHLLYLEQESVVVQLLLDHHLQKDTQVYNFLFNSLIRTKLTDSLYRVMDPFVRQGTHGTDLFWGISEKHCRISLKIQDDKLVSEDGNFSVALTPESLQKALNDGRLMPNLLVIFMVLFLYYGVNCFGGFNQMHYLKAMQDIYNDLAFDNQKSTANPLLYLYGLQSISLALPQNVKYPSQEWVFPYGPDLLLYGDAERWEKINLYFNHLTVREALIPSFQVIYNILFN